MSFPDTLALEGGKGAFELNPVSRTSGVRTVGCPSPNNGVTHARLQVDGLDSDPKGNKFLYVLSDGDSAPQGACLGIVLKLLLNRPVFPSCQLKQMWSEIFGCLPIKTVIVPETGPCTATNLDHC